MKFINKLLVLAIVIFGFSNVDAAANTGVSADTFSIEQNVGKQIRKLPYYGVFDLISYEVDGTTVVLSGSVYNAVNRKSAERNVAGIKGVERVINNIEILPLSGFDNQIRRNTIRTFYRTGGGLYRYLQGANPSIRIIVNRGHVTLEGFVGSKGDSRLAYLLANGVPGTFSVTNNLVIDNDNTKY